LACVVDAVFGTGLKGFRDDLNEIIASFEKTPNIAVDIPSGLMADEVDAQPFQSRADFTVTFTAPKAANVLPPASNFNGELIIADIGSPKELIDEQPSQLYLAETRDAADWLAKTAFPSDDYKNRRGHSLVIAGSEEYSGAAVLAGNAAIRSGVGLVTVVTPRSSKDSVTSRVLPEVMVRGVSETENGAISKAAFDEIGDLLEKADSIAIGCGLSQGESTKRFVEEVVANAEKPIVIDADALNLISPFPESCKSPRVSKGDTLNVSLSPLLTRGLGQRHLILTPHEGEFLRLLGTDKKDAIKDRVAAVREFSTKHDVFLVLKGERVLIGSPDGRVVVNPTGNSGLGKAGNGDTLTGILAGFTAQAARMNVDIFETIVAAVYIAGMAGDIAEKNYGKRVMTASDVRECLTDVFEELGKN
jgi:NAD(P)H-hydrate epimerase